MVHQQVVDAIPSDVPNRCLPCAAHDVGVFLNYQNIVQIAPRRVVYHGRNGRVLF